MADMELVIKIPESYYKIITNKVKIARDDGVYLGWTAIANGTQLPKGHGRLIDADAYKEKIFRVFPCNDRDDKNIRRSTEIAILNEPTIIEADKENKE